MLKKKKGELGEDKRIIKSSLPSLKDICPDVKTVMISQEEIKHGLKKK